jgi:predicted P-loop ATPase
MAELERFTSSKAGDGILKNFITTTHDDFLPPYGRQIMSFPRNCVFIGTVNRVDFLKDPTGSRRFWIIPNVDNVDVEWIDSNRDLLWAAAYQMYQFEPKLPEEDDEALKKVTRLNSVFEYESAWESTIAAYLTQFHKSQITTKEILVDVLKFEISRITRQAEMQVADVMHRLGWQKKVVKLSDRSSFRCWVNPES